MKARLVELYVKEETREKIRTLKLKSSLTYDEFLNELLVNQTKQVRTKNG